jgi:predicted permease
MPDWVSETRRFLSELKLDAAREHELAEELGQHLNDRYEELLAQGASEQEARRTVLEELSDDKLTAGLKPVITPGRETPALGATRDEGLLPALGRDIRHGARLLRLNPMFAAIAILSLALAVGANTAIFQLIDAVQLRLLPVQDPKALANVKVVYAPNGRTGSFRGSFPQLTNGLYEQLRDEQQGFTSLAAWGGQTLNLRQGGEARFAEGMWVSGNFFQTLGLRPTLGRLIAPADDYRGCGTGGAVLSYGFWQSEYGGRDSVIGEKIMLEGHPFEILGVTPPGFYGIDVGRTFDVALPVCAEPVVAGEDSIYGKRDGWFLTGIGRLKTGWTPERASAQLAAISPAILQATLPTNYDETDKKDYLQFRFGAVPASAGLSRLRQDYEGPLWFLMGIAGLVLLIACANLANLMIARASARQREMAIRLAMGASPGRLIRQLLAESMLIATAGALLGALLAQALSRVMVFMLSTDRNPLSLDLVPDWRLFLFTACLAVVTCLLFGLMPALQVSRTAPGEVMKAGATGVSSTPARFGFRRALVASQVALSLVLVVGALLFVRTLENLLNVDAGFSQKNILIAHIDMSPTNMPVAQRRAFKQQILDEIRHIPGVDSSASAHIVPLGGNGWNDNLSIPGSDIRRMVANFNEVSEGYFKTMQTPLLAGRDFNEQDTATAPKVAIVTETFVRKFLKGADPIGTTFVVGQGADKPGQYQIVGLVRDVKYQALREEFSPLVFLAESQDPKPDLALHVMIRTEAPLETVSSAVKQIAARADPALVLAFRVLGTMIREKLLRERVMASLSTFFGTLAALLAMVGLYGVVSYMVMRRRNEIGVRMALGANRSDILRMIMAEAGKLLAIGVVMGAALSMAAATAANALLYGLKPRDPITLVSAAVALGAVALLASFIPAVRAARLEPMTALREE